MIEIRAYEGLIRNHAALAEELQVNTDGLTRREREERLLLAAYQAWGKDMGSHLNGQFALALQDTESEELFCLRDRTGAELLFYYQTADGQLLVATRIKDLFDQPGFQKELDPDLIQFYLAFNYIPGEETLFKGVRKLEPGGWLTFGKEGLAIGQWWVLALEPDESKTLEEWADEIERTMEQSLACLMDEGEVPDSFLSSGVDSSFITAKSHARKAFCVSYEDQGVSEEKDASATASYLGSQFRGITVSPEELFANVDDFLIAYEQPSADIAGLSLFTACKKIAAESDLCLSGEGADEFFAGYNFPKRLLKAKPGSKQAYHSTNYIMDAREQGRFLKHYCPQRSTEDFIQQRSAPARNYDALARMLYLDLKTYFEGSILFNSTKIVQGTGLDIRMPFMDDRMLEIACRMPSRFKASEEGNKLALRKAASRVLPQEVAYRKKLGFPVPARAWLADPRYNADIHRAFASETAARFFDLAEIGALLEALEGGKPKRHRIWFYRHRYSTWRYVWTIYLFIRWYELFFKSGKA